MSENHPDPKKIFSKPQKNKTKKLNFKIKPKSKKTFKDNKKSVDPDSPFAVLEKLL